ncbi:serine/threonine-protein kinase [Microbacterium sp. GXF7504]
MTEPFTTDAPDVGDLVAERYRLHSLLGQGGMARVYLATDEHLDRDVAIKLFRAGAGDDDDLARARSEMRLLASVSHPALVTLHDAVLLPDGPQFLVMEHVPGVTLREHIAAGPLPPREVAAAAAELAEGLHVVHAAGVVHRDLKPSNILTWPSTLPDRAFRVKLADFGIAYLSGATRLTTPGTLIGTAAYLAPEQARGDAVTPATDVYAMGLVLLEALTGERAFPQPSAPEAVMARLSGPPRIPDTVPAAWRTLLASMTATDPAERPSAIEVAAEAARLPHAPAVGAASAPVALVDTAPLDPAQTVAAHRVPVPTAETVPVAPADDQAGRPPSGTDASEPTSTEVLPPVHRRSRRPLLVIGSLVATAVVAAGIAWAARSPRPSDDAPPTLPAVEEPLGGHLDDLMEAVTP